MILLLVFGSWLGVQIGRLRTCNYYRMNIDTLDLLWPKEDERQHFKNSFIKAEVAIMRPITNCAQAAHLPFYVPEQIFAWQGFLGDTLSNASRGFSYCNTKSHHAIQITQSPNFMCQRGYLSVFQTRQNIYPHARQVTFESCPPVQKADCSHIFAMKSTHMKKWKIKRSWLSPQKWQYLP